jgi:hypothetical protein
MLESSNINFWRVISLYFPLKYIQIILNWNFNFQYRNFPKKELGKIDYRKKQKIHFYGKWELLISFFRHKKSNSRYCHEKELGKIYDQKGYDIQI